MLTTVDPVVPSSPPSFIRYRHERWLLFDSDSIARSIEYIIVKGVVPSITALVVGRTPPSSFASVDRAGHAD
ncbi:hypothetical protein BHE74_00040601 [Ensete ventricosum]|nr:hypothetical protein GW17_00040223 [Ensete ventricosum]RWW52957.1 hypothetical protein BHE74_00040601 [Ensete ventricosum]